ncbi:MAG: hypothetical protein QXG03_00225 [Halalkalicoccus sp.]
MRDIAEQVAAWEHDTTVQQLTSDQRQRVYIALYQSHLPKLADFDLITYNRSRGIVERTALADQVTRYLDEDVGEDRAVENAVWMRYYGGATVLSIGIVLLAWSGLFPLRSIGPAALITAMYAIVTVAFVQWSRN